jgi:hypothetical protein
MLEGFENAGIKVKSERLELVVRKLNAAGQQRLVLKALQRAKSTGVRLRDRAVLLQVLRGIHDQAALSDWDKEETAKALRFAKQVTELLEDEEHCGGKGRGEMVGKEDWRGKPEVVAVPTELAAKLAERYEGDVTEVKALASRLVGALKQDDYTVSSLSSLIFSHLANSP